ncbi:MAG: type I restriction endonuclease [Fibrobacteraceae bacterium]
MKYSIVAENPECTVVAEYHAAYRTEKTYQSEADLERAFIEQLQAEAYEYLPIRTEAELIENLRRQLEKLNGCRFFDAEWNLFFKSKLANPNSGIEERTKIIQEDSIQLFTRDDGTIASRQGKAGDKLVRGG